MLILVTILFSWIVSEAAYPVHTKFIVADFSNGKEIYQRIKQEINVPVGILGLFVFMFQSVD